jgi:Bacterial regulatory proteins, lacI family
LAERSAPKKQAPEDIPERMDIRTIARLANVSIATVSRTINRVSTVNPKMAKRVWDVIEKFDFVPNTQARALVSGRSKLFGLLISEITNPSSRALKTSPSSTATKSLSVQPTTTQSACPTASAACSSAKWKAWLS